MDKSIVERLKDVTEKLEAKNAAQEEIKNQFSDKAKTKPLTIEERVDRIETFLGLK